jgi:hypothetical protein
MHLPDRSSQETFVNLSGEERASNWPRRSALVGLVVRTFLPLRVSSSDDLAVGVRISVKHILCIHCAWLGGLKQKELAGFPVHSHGFFSKERRWKELCEAVTGPWNSVKPGIHCLQRQFAVMNSLRDPLLLLTGMNSVSRIVMHRTVFVPVMNSACSVTVVNGYEQFSWSDTAARNSVLWKR